MGKGGGNAYALVRAGPLRRPNGHMTGDQTEKAEMKSSKCGQRMNSRLYKLVVREKMNLNKKQAWM